MKILQRKVEEKWQFQSFAELKGVVYRPESASEVILLLHGLGERGKRIFRKLISFMPENALILAPNGPFPIQRNKENRSDFGFSWYFYDKFENSYFINQDLAKNWIRDLLNIENPNKLPVRIIGFSQGGYLAPVVANYIPEADLVIGLSCEFKSSFFIKKPHYALVAVHGEKDDVVPFTNSIAQIENLKEFGISVDVHCLKNLKHEISPETGKIVQLILEKYGKRSL